MNQFIPQLFPSKCRFAKGTAFRTVKNGTNLAGENNNSVLKGSIAHNTKDTQ